MFPDLPALEADEDSAIGLGRASSHMDGTLPVVDSALENPRIPAGFAILGQFVAHDITADRSLLAPRESVEDLRNFRVPRLDLKCLYGDGPAGTPFLYDTEDPDKLLLGANAAGQPTYDLPRNHQGTALVGDPRNDAEEECGLNASGWVRETPLWYYVLKEAEVRAGGEHLGEFGDRIVAEVLLGLLEADPSSFKVEPGWRPVLPAAQSGTFTMADLLRFAGVSTRTV